MLTQPPRVLAGLAVPALVALATLATSPAGAAAARGHSSAATAPSTLLGALITRRPDTMAVGHSVPGRDISGARVFCDARHGLALAHDGQADYPVASSDGGHSWHTAGPALHVDAADGPDAVSAVGREGCRTLFVWGPNVIDASPDGGHSWYRVRPQDFVVGVDAGLRGIDAQVQQIGSGPAVSATVQYVSGNGGRSWRLSRQIGG